MRYELKLRIGDCWAGWLGAKSTTMEIVWPRSEGRSETMASLARFCATFPRFLVGFLREETDQKVDHRGKFGVGDESESRQTGRFLVISVDIGPFVRIGNDRRDRHTTILVRRVFPSESNQNAGQIGLWFSPVVPGV